MKLRFSKTILSLSIIITSTLTFAGGQDIHGSARDESQEKRKDVGYGNAFDFDFKDIAEQIADEIKDAGLTFSELGFEPNSLRIAIDQFTPLGTDTAFKLEDQEGKHALGSIIDKTILFSNGMWVNYTLDHKRYIVLHEYLNRGVLIDMDNDGFYTRRTLRLLKERGYPREIANIGNNKSQKTQSSQTYIISTVTLGEQTLDWPRDVTIQFKNKPSLIGYTSTRCSNNFKEGSNFGNQIKLTTAKLRIVNQKTGYEVTYTKEFKRKDKEKCQNFLNYLMSADSENPIEFYIHPIDGLWIK